MNTKVKNGLIIFGVLCLIVGIILVIIHFTKKCPQGTYKGFLSCKDCKEGNYCYDNKSYKCPNLPNNWTLSEYLCMKDICNCAKKAGIPVTQCEGSPQRCAAAYCKATQQALPICLKEAC